MDNVEVPDSEANDTNNNSSPNRKRTREEENEEDGKDSSKEDETNNSLASMLPVIGDDGTVTFPLSAVHGQFVCSLCSGYYKEPYTITDCLHTFCKSCLFYSIACGCHECPECHLFLGSDPIKAATLDSALQELVEITFPELAKREEQEAIEFYESRGIPLKTKAMTTTPSRRQKFGFDGSAAHRDTTGGAQDNTKDKSGKKKKDELEIALVPERESNGGEQLVTLDRPFLVVSGRLKMNQLKRYLVEALALPSTYKTRIDILCNGVPVGDEISLSFVNRLLWPHESNLELTYKVTK